MTESPTARKNVIVLLSGGMDSVVALHQAHRDHHVVATLSADYGSKHNHCELPMAAKQSELLGVRHECAQLGFMDQLFSSALLNSGGDIPDGHYEEESMKQTVVPFRNGILLSIAAGFAESVGATGVVIAAHSGDHAIYPDCRESFMAPMAEAIKQGTYEDVEVMRPFINMTKTEIAQRGAELGVDFSLTWSCYKGGDIHCGTCGTCVERKEAFRDAGIPDPTEYLA
ncbi:7-cyano-7-deazaguanine synthase QueC [Sulfuriroseicoccus oceanibius]|uniref:7-cyano-7-deazaguanine synthase n=1 Tax=Sulfuriroseicoccus oceanibius TaxID=2707525 RepID=A0A6B3L9R4_9BACT|nr:7-cyano-7-deazaguanine synthase QueC [Sulfuriroseicoccus oceanibius]QQL45709.1 7-cyano-7-deazaguanine synthase QueC [Sulfuriroseicoccus oceanibius]